MTSSIGALTFDCDDAQILSAFWSGVLGATVDPDESEAGPYFQSIGRSNTGWPGPILMFMKVPEGKSAKNRVHLDLSTTDVEAEVARLLELGASQIHHKQESGIEWTTLADPEGNEFCVASTGHY
jgi:predicted enzyme related to lactoylglutathione lyase